MSEEQPPQGTIEIGDAGPNMVRETYDHENLALLIAKIKEGKLKEGKKLPDWYEETARKSLLELIKPNVTYRFVSHQAGYYWTLTRIVTKYLLMYSQRMLAEPDNAALRKGSWKAGWCIKFALIAPLCTGFQTAAEGPFSFLNQQYLLKKPFPDVDNHIYVYRGADSIVYHGLTVAAARSILAELEQPEDRKISRDDIDDFVCAFFAEPTRWPEEQIYNLFATLAATPDTLLTGENGILPLASGSTWEAKLNVPGREVPKRIVDFALITSLHHVLEQEVTLADTVNAFAAQVLNNMLPQ
ncbi:hypothetical protein ACGFNU_38120 [Spirillospora sp. NPDC048911]|uniref:hypothetical protein n=1 Tax=Spirillospora sp. NPDC048911 TaxID=3364527 RepID=UPI00371DDF55